MRTIFYNPEIDLCLSHYGIEIPIVDDRALQVFKQFKEEVDQSITILDTELVPIITKEDLLLCHKEEFVEDLYRSEKSLEREILKAYELVDDEGNFHRYNPSNQIKKLSSAFDIILTQVGVTYLASKNSLQTGFSYFLGGGMHHAMTFGGRGFCLINDIVISLRKLQKENLIKTAWVIDVDAHKGDGTAECTALDSSIITLSIHMNEGWPLNSGTVRSPWFIPSNIDIGVEENDEKQYLSKLKDGLLELKEQFPLPDLCIVVNGADPYEFDELESANLLKLTKEQLLERDKMVYTFLKDLKIPQTYLMAGGYGSKSWEIYFEFLKFVGKSSS